MSYRASSTQEEEGEGEAYGPPGAQVVLPYHRGQGFVLCPDHHHTALSQRLVVKGQLRGVQSSFSAVAQRESPRLLGDG